MNEIKIYKLQTNAITQYIVQARSQKNEPTKIKSVPKTCDK